MLPEIDGCGLRFPDPRIVYAGQFGQRAIFRTEGDILVGLGHDGGLAGDRVAYDAEAVLGADDEGEEAVEIGERAFQRLAQILAMRHLRGEIGGRDLGVVLGFEFHAFADQLATDIVVVGQRAIVHQALVGAGRKRMRTHGRHRRFRCHAGMADAVRAAHLADIEAINDRLRQADLLVDLDHVAGAHDADVGAQRLDGLARFIDLGRLGPDDRMGRFHRDRHRRADGFGEFRFEAREIAPGLRRLDGDLGFIRGGGAIDGDAGTVGAAIAERDQHLRQHRAKLGFQRLVLQKQSDNSTHVSLPAFAALR